MRCFAAVLSFRWAVCVNDIAQWQVLLLFAAYGQNISGFLAGTAQHRSGAAFAGA